MDFPSKKSPAFYDPKFYPPSFKMWTSTTEINLQSSIKYTHQFLSHKTTYLLSNIVKTEFRYISKGFLFKQKICIKKFIWKLKNSREKCQPTNAILQVHSRSKKHNWKYKFFGWLLWSFLICCKDSRNTLLTTSLGHAVFETTINLFNNLTWLTAGYWNSILGS